MLYCLEIGFIVPNMEIRFCFWKKLTRNGSWESEAWSRETKDWKLQTGNGSWKSGVSGQDWRLETRDGSWKLEVRSQGTKDCILKTGNGRRKLEVRSCQCLKYVDHFSLPTSVFGLLTHSSMLFSKHTFFIRWRNRLVPPPSLIISSNCTSLFLKTEPKIVWMFRYLNISGLRIVDGPSVKILAIIRVELTIFRKVLV